MQKTKFKTISELKPVWYLVDAKDKILGRIAVEVADKLNGKNLPGISPNQYCQSKVVVINTNQVKTTGNKLTNKVYIHHTGFPKGLRSVTLGEAMQKAQQSAPGQTAGAEEKKPEDNVKDAEYKESEDKK